MSKFYLIKNQMKSFSDLEIEKNTPHTRQWAEERLAKMPDIFFRDQFCVSPGSGAEAIKWLLEKMAIVQLPMNMSARLPRRAYRKIAVVRSDPKTPAPSP